MYGGCFPPLGDSTPVEVPPLRFVDREGREIDLAAFGDGPRDDEYGALLDLYREFDPAFRTLGVPPVGEERLRRWLDALLDGYCVLAWHGERTVGQAVLLPSPHDPGYELAVFLHQDYHGAGIGTRLVRALLGYGRERGVERVWVLVAADNRHAVDLFTDLGFVVSGRAGADLEMALSLTPPDPVAPAG